MSNYEVIAVRDPDGGTDLYLFVDGEQVEAQETIVDAGAGYDRDSWKEARDTNLANASDNAWVLLRGVYADPPGGEYVSDRDDADWLEGVPEVADADWPKGDA